MVAAHYVLALLMTPGIGRRTVQYFLDEVDRHVYDITATQNIIDVLDALRKTRPRTRVPSLEELQTAYGQAESILEGAANRNIRVLGPSDIPQRLQHIPDPPVILYAKGDISCLVNQPVTAVIGTREPSDFGLRMSSRLGKALSERGITVVSGLAIGCDTAAHEACLDAGGLTAAVLAHGLDAVYPAKNRGLAERILEQNGCLISEYPVGAEPQASFFVERDRLQSGISHGVIVVETDIKGGTMHTVGFAQKQGRVLACAVHPPKYSSHPKSHGNRHLLAQQEALPLGTSEELEAFVTSVRAGYRAEQSLSAEGGKGEESSGIAGVSLAEDDAVKGVRNLEVTSSKTPYSKGQNPTHKATGTKKSRKSHSSTGQHSLPGLDEHDQ